jgi:murein DD-endopeptidase MepM/ murein hydrolase activator NlpD
MASYQPDQSSAPAVTGTVQAPPAQPRNVQPASSAQLPAPVGRAPAKSQAKQQPSVHIVAPGETLIKISRMYGKSLTEVARINKIAPHTKVNIGDRIIIPGARASGAARKDAPSLAQAKPVNPPAHAQGTPKPAPVLASNPTTESASVVTPAAASPPPAGPVRAAHGAPSFRWPAKGRVIAGFGPRTNGQQNDGINLALPEGTPVKASENGVVAYAGNELKGYGNLVLVRHANGYVTAYAHARELLVKRGDQVKRGQIIAKSGQTGNVDAPQLHFEIRKGPSPLDPMPLLSGG